MTESRWVATLERLADTSAARHSWYVPSRASGSGDAGKSLAERRGMGQRPGDGPIAEVPSASQPLPIPPRAYGLDIPALGQRAMHQTTRGSRVLPPQG
jgi:hypothetical protein